MGWSSGARRPRSPSSRTWSSRRPGGSPRCCRTARSAAREGRSTTCGPPTQTARRSGARQPCSRDTGSSPSSR
eukprot:629320-Alexandrium_andersonii.AAC.1